MTLQSGEIHLWFADLRSHAYLSERMHRMLSADERTRASSYAFDLHRNRFVLRRGVLRSILSEYLGQPPGDVTFTYGLTGKPAVSGGPRFNLSDTEDYLMVALTRDRDLGVDIEVIREVPDATGIAADFFSLAETTALRSLAACDRMEGFLACWTRKEAFLKATGVGLSTPLDSFDVELHPCREPRFLRMGRSWGTPDDWSLYDLRPNSQVIGALAIPGHGWHLRSISDFRFSGM